MVNITDRIPGIWFMVSDYTATYFHLLTQCCHPLFSVTSLFLEEQRLYMVKWLWLGIHLWKWQVGWCSNDNGRPWHLVPAITDWTAVACAHDNVRLYMEDTFCTQQWKINGIFNIMIQSGVNSLTGMVHEKRPVAARGMARTLFELIRTCYISD